MTHVDYSARVQTVDDERNPLLHQLLTAFHERTGCPVLVNTSFNVRGEPIVCTPQEAYRCFRATDMDALVLEDCVGSYFPEFQVAALKMIKAQGGIFGWVSDSQRFLKALARA